MASPLILTYNITVPGFKLVLPIYGGTITNIDWGDGNTSTNQIYTYVSAGTYTVSITGTGIIRMRYDDRYSPNPTGAQYLISCTSFGQIGLINLSYAFAAAVNLVSVPTSLPTTVTSIGIMFYQCSAFNQDISSWDVLNIINMTGLFYQATAFNNGGVALTWGSKTNKVKYMRSVFYGAISFNQNISGWDTSSLLDIAYMFNGASLFNQDISGFNISTVTSMDNIFDNSGLSTTNYNNILNYWASLSVTSGLLPGGSGLTYSQDGSTAHNTLSSAPNNWVFNGDAYIPSDTLSINIPFNFTVNNNNIFSIPETITLTAPNLSPPSSNFVYDGISPSQFVFSNLRFTTGGTKTLVTLTGLTSGVTLNYYLDVLGPSCFMENTKILTSKGYIPIENIRKGDLIKTLNDEYIPVNMIGKTKLYNSGNNLRSKEKLYLCTVEKYIELTEDLIITGCHGILIDEFENDIQKELTIEAYGKIYATEGKYRLPACVDHRTVPYDKEGVFNIWHLALDNDNYYMNYGIYANGLLVETCSQRYLKELSGMDLVE